MLNRRRRGGIVSLPLPFLLLSLAAFAFSLLATLAITRTLTTWSLVRRIRSIEEATKWRRRGRIDGIDSTTPDDDSLLLSSHLALFDDEGGEEEDEGENEEEAGPSPAAAAAGACAPMEHTE